MIVAQAQVEINTQVSPSREEVRRARVIDFNTGEILTPENPDYQRVMIASAVYEKAQNRNSEEIAKIERAELEDIGYAPHGYIVLGAGCGGGRRVVPIVCSDHTCVPCERRRSIMVRRRWWPIFQNMKAPKFITFTIRDGDALEERIDTFHKSFRRLFKLRLGRDNLKRIRAEALSFLRDHLKHQVTFGKRTKAGIEKVSVAQAISTYKAQKQSIDKFIRSVIREHDKTGEWPEMRHRIGKGFASLEVVDNGDWHVHRHLCVDTQFIPWAFLCATWIIATHGEGSVTYITEVEKTYQSLKELVKYMTKGWEVGTNGDIQDVSPEEQSKIQAEKLAELRVALRNKKQIWPIGGAKPVESKSTCPYCNKPECKCHQEGQAKQIDHGEINGMKYRLFQMVEDTPTIRQFVMLRGDDGRWREAPLIYTTRLCVAPSGKPIDLGWDNLMEIKRRRHKERSEMALEYA